MPPSADNERLAEPGQFTAAVGGERALSFGLLGQQRRVTQLYSKVAKGTLNLATRQKRLAGAQIPSPSMA